MEGITYWWIGKTFDFIIKRLTMLVNPWRKPPKVQLTWMGWKKNHVDLSVHNNFFSSIEFNYLIFRCKLYSTIRHFTCLLSLSVFCWRCRLFLFFFVFFFSSYFVILFILCFFSTWNCYIELKWYAQALLFNDVLLFFRNNVCSVYIGIIFLFNCVHSFKYARNLLKSV